MGPAWMTSNVLPHDVDDGGADETVLDDEGEEIGRCVFDDRAHDVDAATGVGGQQALLAGDQRLGVHVEARVPQRTDQATVQGGSSTAVHCRAVDRGVEETRYVVGLAVRLEV